MVATTVVALPDAFGRETGRGRGRTALARRQFFVAFAFVLLAFVPLRSNGAIVIWTLLLGFVIVSVVAGSGGQTRFMVSLTILGAGIMSTALVRGLLLGIGLQGIATDALDAMRFAPVVAVAVGLVRGGRGVDLTPTLAVVCIVDAAISVGEFLVPGPFRLLYLAHGTEHHWTTALQESARTAGLYGSPGEHGAAMALFGAIVLFRLVRQPRPLLMAGVLAAIVAVLMSQSQTSFVAFAIGASIIALWSVVRLRSISTLRAIRWLTVSAAVLGPALILFVTARLRYLTFLFTVGPSRSSYQLREELWASIWSRWDDTFTSVLIGGGRTWLGDDLTSVVDSDLRYVLYIYGVLGWAMLVVAYVAWVRASRVFRPEAIVAATMALVSSWASSFIADARMLTVVIVVLVFGPATSVDRRSRTPPSRGSA